MSKKVALVTGGTGGIGTAICQRLSQDYQVVACYFKHGKHEEAKKWQVEQKELGYDLDIIYGDVAQFTDCERIAEEIIKRYGQIDVLINNAGVTQDCSLRKMTPEQWQQVLDANLTSVFNMTRNVIPHMLDCKYGRIVSISSINGRKGQFGQCNYASTKSALFGFTKSLALEVAMKGVTVNTISPGYIETSMLSGLRPEVLDSIIANIPVGRLGTPEEIADAVAFLIDEKSGFITGANLDINGGQYM
ncbi:MAG: beta-ketoacyl-ACP reductase [Legionella sp. 40-6]|nr:acetoacetyl-CoA reductase [Legionella sp.]OJX98205.1 MAG: beta-ketoacyl-ACP reductase [Legionella sp. 40-6]